MTSPMSAPGWWVPAETGRPGYGLSTQPSGTMSSMELKNPSFLGISGSIMAATWATV